MFQQKLQGFRRRLIDSLAVAAAFAPGLALANPSGGAVTAGAATIGSPAAGTVRIDQTSANAIIEWRDFSIGTGEFVQFVQPDSSATVLNRVTGGLPSDILGNLSADGRVFIINPQGVMFGATARVDTAALVATTFDIADGDFLNGHYAFAGDPANMATVVNQGQIVAADGGFVVLSGAKVSNEGLVQARLGQVALLSGSAMTLTLDAAGLIGYTLDADAMGDATGAFNSGDLLAEGGQVVMSARVARSMAGQAVNNTGRISARSVDDQAGTIYLSAHGGDIGQIGNVETAGDPGQPGGEIIVEADSLAVGAGPAAGCATTVCEEQLEDLLSQGTGIGLFARDALAVADLADDELNGQSAGSNGGFLLLGIGTNNDGAGYLRGSNGSIHLADTDDQLLLDGDLQAYAGSGSGSLTIGNVLSREFIFLEAADDIQAGALTHAAAGVAPQVSLFSQNGGIVTGAIDARNNVYIEAAGSVAVNGNIKVVGSIAGADPQSFSVIGSRLEITSHGGDITVNGGLQQQGNVDGFAGNNSFSVRGAYAEFDAGDGDVRITGPVTMQGTIGTVSGDVDWSALGSQLTARARGGVVELQGSVNIGGSVGTALGNARLAVRGSEMSLGSAVDDGRAATTDVIVGGPVTMTGSVGTLFMDNNGEVIGSFFQIGAIGGEARVNGAVDVSGSVGELGANFSVGAIGGFAEFVADGGDIVTGSSFAVSGSVGTAGMDTGLTANGASLLVGQRNGNVLLGGAVQVIGQVDNVGANTAAEVRAADFVIHATGGSIVADSTLHAEGTAGTIGVGSDSFNNGVFIDLQADANVILHGNLGAVGNLVSLGAGSGVSAQAAEVQIIAQNILADGSLLIQGTTGTVGAGENVFASGASLDLNSNGGTIDIVGDLGVSGDLGDTGTGGNLVARAADLIVRGGDVAVGGDILLVGHTAAVSAADTAFVAGSYLEVVADGTLNLGGIQAAGTLDSTETGGKVDAEATAINIKGGTVTVHRDVLLSGATGSVVTGNGIVDDNGNLQQALVFGSLLSIEAGGNLSLAGKIEVSGDLQSVTGSDSLPDPFLVGSRAAGVRLSSAGGNVTVDGSILLQGHTGNVNVGSDSFTNGAFLSLTADVGEIIVHGNVRAEGSLNRITAGDFMFAEATSLELRAQAISIDGNLGLDGSNGKVIGGNNATVSGSSLDLKSQGADAVIGGNLTVVGKLGLDGQVLVGIESLAQAVAVEAVVDGAALRVLGNIDANGQTGTTGIGSVSFINGVSMNLSANAVVVGGNLGATGILGDTTAGFAVGAEAADLVVHGQFISIGGDLSLTGNTGAVTTGDNSGISGSYLEAISNFDLLIGGDLKVSGNLSSVAGSDPNLPSSFIGASATNVILRTEQSGDLVIGGDVTLEGHTGSVVVGENNSSNGVLVKLGATDFNSEGYGNIIVRGALTANGTLASTTAGNNLFARATEVKMTTAGGSIQLDGDILLSGSNGMANIAANAEVNAISVEFDVVQGGNVGFGGDFTASGTLGSVSGGAGILASGTELDLQILGGQFNTVGNVTVTGTTNTVTGFNDVTVSGVFVSLDSRQGALHVGGDLGTHGTLGSVSGESSVTARAANLEVFTVNGDLDVDGDLVVQGTTGNVQGFNSVSVNGAYANLVTVAGSVLIGGSVDMDGTLGSVQAEFFAFASGAELLALPDGTFDVAGDLRVSGTLDSFTALDSSGAFGADVFVFSGSSDLAGDARVGGAVEVAGTLEAVSGGNELFSYGAFASFASFQGAVRLEGPVTVQGELGSVVSGDTLDVSGAGFWADASNGDVELAGPLLITGSVQSVDAANGAFLNGAFAYLTATEGDLTVNGNLTLTGTLTAVMGDSGIAASGADLLLERTASIPGGQLTVNGNLAEQGSIGSFEVADLASSSRFNGGVLLNASDGSLSFREVTADNAFVYFNQDSSIGTGKLTAREYLEIVTPSGSPTLVADSLTITAPEVFISANLDAGTLAVQGTTSLAVSAARLHADNLSLSSSGLLQLADDSASAGVVTEISGGSVQLSGGRVISDAGTLIDAGGLDVTATETIRLAGSVRVGHGLTQASGDTALLQQLAEGASGVVPLSAQPNAYFRAPTVALAQLELAGDYLHIEADTMRLGTLMLQDGTLVHFDPLRNLPFFTESVDVTDAGLDSVKDRLNTENNRVIPNLGAFNDGSGTQELGDRPVLNDGRTDQTGDPQFQVGGGVANLGQLVQQSGLIDNTVVIGGSDYTAAIQVVDQLIIDVLPSETNFVFATSSKVLITEPIRTNGLVIVLGGGVETDRSTFYSTVVDEINDYYQALEPDTPDEDDGEVEEKSGDSAECAG